MVWDGSQKISHREGDIHITALVQPPGPLVRLAKLVISSYQPTFLHVHQLYIWITIENITASDYSVYSANCFWHTWSFVHLFASERHPDVILRTLVKKQRGCFRSATKTELSLRWHDDTAYLTKFVVDQWFFSGRSDTPVQFVPVCQTRLVTIPDWEIEHKTEFEFP